MSIGGPANIPQALDLFFLPQLRMDEHFMELAKDAYYTAYTRFVAMDDPAGDQIYHVYSEPLAAMPEWKGPRHVAEVDFRTWSSAVRTFASGLLVNVDDIKPDSGSPAKLAAYRQVAQRLFESALLVWPQTVVDMILGGNALTYSSAGLAAAKTWKPDGQNIFDNHPVKPSDTSLGYFRNYRSKDSTGGSAAYPISYGNELAILKAGRQFVAPNGKEMPIRYNKVICSAGNGPLLSRLLHDEEINAGEVDGQTLASATAGGKVPNEIARHYDGTAIEVVEFANIPANLRLYIDTTRASEAPIRLKERQPITWQYQGPGGPEGAFPVGNDEGMVPGIVYEQNAVKYGPKARGECYAANWWRMFLADSQA